MEETLESFYKVCIKNEVPTINERSLTPEIYYNSTLRFIDVQVEGNMAFRKPVAVIPAAEEKYAGGDPSILTNGVQGAHDFAVHWLGWWGKDATITVDLEDLVSANTIGIGTLWDGRSWILHPSKIICRISVDGIGFKTIGGSEIFGDQNAEEITRKYTFNPGDNKFRFVRFEIKGFGPLPKWHASEGEPSWFFVDELTVF
jgi:hypothetical protein